MMPHTQILVMLDAATRYTMVLVYAAVLWFTCMAIANGLGWAWQKMRPQRRRKAMP